jgi:antitoxin VapB
MPHQLNIKDPETNTLVAELSELTGRSKTEAVRLAVKSQLEQEKRRRREDREATLLALRELRAKALALRKPGDDLTEDDLYDEYGLPK